jgi:hypothetical protein
LPSVGATVSGGGWAEGVDMRKERRTTDDGSVGQPSSRSKTPEVNRRERARSRADRASRSSSRTPGPESGKNRLGPKRGRRYLSCEIDFRKIDRPLPR